MHSGEEDTLERCHQWFSGFQGGVSEADSGKANGSGSDHTEVAVPLPVDWKDCCQAFCCCLNCPGAVSVDLPCTSVYFSLGRPDSRPSRPLSLAWLMYMCMGCLWLLPLPRVFGIHWLKGCQTSIAPLDQEFTQDSWQLCPSIVLIQHNPKDMG